MVKNRINYKPQVRNRTAKPLETDVRSLDAPHANLDSLPLYDMEFTHEVTLHDRLAAIMETKDDTLATQPENIPAILLRRNVMLCESASSGEVMSENGIRYLSLITARSVIDALYYFYETMGIDFCNDPDTLTNMNTSQKKSILNDILGKSLAVGERGSTEFTIEEATHRQYRDKLIAGSRNSIATAFMANRRVASTLRDAYRNDRDRVIQEGVDIARHLGGGAINATGAETLTLLEINALRDMTIMKRAAGNPARYRHQNASLFTQLMHPEMVAFIDQQLNEYETDWLTWSEGDNEELADTELLILEGGQELDYAILPEGRGIREYVEVLCENLPTADRPHVDLERLSVLEAIRTVFGADTTYFVHGKPRGSVASDDGQLINEAYIGLVIQYHDQKTGAVSGEDIIAVSPIAKKHAGYIVRHDSPLASETKWRKTLAKPKAQACKYGARPLKFTNVTGANKYEAYVEKAIELLTCPIDQYGVDYELSRSPDGTYRMRKRLIKGIADVAVGLSL